MGLWRDRVARAKLPLRVSRRALLHRRWLGGASRRRRLQATGAAAHLEVDRPERSSPPIRVPRTCRENSSRPARPDAPELRSRFFVEQASLCGVFCSSVGHATTLVMTVVSPWSAPWRCSPRRRRRLHSTGSTLATESMGDDTKSRHSSSAQNVGDGVPHHIRSSLAVSTRKAWKGADESRYR